MRLINYLFAGIFFMAGLWCVAVAQETEPDINAFIPVEKEPFAENLAEVRKTMGYPEEAIAADAQGTVVARVLVSKEGTYLKHKIVKEIHPKLAEAVIEALPKLKFTPAIQEGNPITYWVNIPFPFKLLNNAEVVQRNIDKLTDELEADPENYEIWQRRGIQRSSIEQYEDAVVDFTQSITLNPKKNKKKKSKNTYEYLIYAHYSRGAAYFQLEKFDEALADYAQALTYASEMKVADSAIEATVPNIYLERGYMYSTMEKYPEAKMDYNWVLENQPDQKCIVYPLLRDIGLAENNNEELVKYYDGIIECDSGNVLLFYSRGFYKLESGDPDGAIKDFTLVAEKHQNIALRIAAHNMSSLAYMEKKNYDQAYAEIDKALKINVLNPQSYFFKGKILHAEGKDEEACKSFENAIDFGIDGDDLDEITELRKTLCGVEE